MSHLSDVIIPHISDSGGYAARRRDLAFVRVTESQLENCRQRERPLGLSETEYRELAQGIIGACEQDGLTDCDIRIQGSSTTLFSSSHKTMPTARKDLSSLYMEHRKMTPEPWEIDEVERKLWSEWVSDNRPPNQPLFDCLLHLGLSTEPSDIDIQVSSDQLAERCVGILVPLGFEREQITILQPRYNFILKHLVEKAAPFLEYFRNKISEQIRRDVSIAAFPSCGPPEASELSELSSHFKDSDWIVQAYGRHPSRVLGGASDG